MEKKTFYCENEKAYEAIVNNGIDLVVNEEMENEFDAEKEEKIKSIMDKFFPEAFYCID